MAEPLSSIDNTTVATQNPTSHQTLGDEPTDDKSPFRRIEFVAARKPFTGFGNGGGGDGGFRIETLNPNGAVSARVTSGGQGGVGEGRKRDAAEMESGVDPELSFGITFRRIGAGLENLGNTCFLNSVLQCLTYTEPLAAYLQSGKHQVTCRKSGFCALCAIQKHVSRALQLSGRSLAPKDLVSNLRCISRTFRNSRQEDAHEYMVNLLESMHKCCLPNGVPSESQSAYDRSLVHKIFGGRLRSQVKCMQCNYCSNKFDPFLDLSLEILRADTLYKAFQNFTAKEQLDGGAKQYQCQQCKQKVKALKQLTIHKPPNVLTVHLKRFGSHMSGQKIDKKILFGPTLDLKPFVTGPNDGDLKYTLYGVLVHAGWSTHSGHYYCFVRTSSGMWYALDDNRVSQVSEKTVFDQKAYMLFYFKDRKNLIPTKKTTDVLQKEKIAMNGTPNGLQKDKIAMNGTPNGPGGSREAQMNSSLSNGSLNCQPSLETNTKADQKEKIVMNGAPNGPGAPKDTQMKTGSNDGALNAGIPLAANGAEGNGLSAVAPKKTPTNSDINSTSSNGQKSSTTVGTMTNGFSTSVAEATKEKQASVQNGISEPSKTEDHAKEVGGAGSSDGNLGGNGHVEKALGGKTDVEKLLDLPKEESALEKKAIGLKTHSLETLDVPKMELLDLPIMEKATGGKAHKKAKNRLKCKIVSMKFSANVLMGTSALNQRKKKKHKRNKRVKNLGQENLVNEGLSSSVKTEPQKTVNSPVENGHKKHLGQENLVNEGPSSSVKTEPQKTVKPPVENGLKERVDRDAAVLATSDSNGDPTGTQSNPKESNPLAQKDLVRMLTTGMDDIHVPRWDEDESATSQSYRPKARELTIGYIGDEWDEEYDRGKRKKVRMSRTEFDGKNPFQVIANERINSHFGRQDLSKRPPMITVRCHKVVKKSRHVNRPGRI